MTSHGNEAVTHVFYQRMISIVLLLVAFKRNMSVAVKVSVFLLLSYFVVLLNGERCSSAVSHAAASFEGMLASASILFCLCTCAVNGFGYIFH